MGHCQDKRLLNYFNRIIGILILYHWRLNKMYCFLLNILSDTKEMIQCNFISLSSTAPRGHHRPE